MRAAALALGAALAAAGAVPEPEPLILGVRYTPADQKAGRYQCVPFDVPEGTTRLEIEYRYDRAGGANVVDLGLFEPGSLELSSAAFRGWSGGGRSRISVGVSSATPGYWAGPLPAGRWNVVLGLYKVVEAGVDVDVTVARRRDREPSPRPLPSRPPGPVRTGPAWFSGGLHLHTVHSDGKLAVADLLAGAKAEGLDFVAITDHNNTAHQADEVSVPGLLRIVGEEVTTPGGHASVWGLGGPRDYVDFRVLPGDPRIGELVAAVRKRGALFSINHPVSDCLACSWTHAIPEGVVGIEVWNGRHGAQPEALALWDRLLGEGRRITGVGSSDWHRPPDPIGNASVRVWAPELSEAAILKGIADGRVVVMADARTPPPVVRLQGPRGAGAGELALLSRDYAVEVDAPDHPAYVSARAQLVVNGAPGPIEPLAPGRFARFPRRPAEDAHVRVHVLRPDGTTLAITNPVFVRKGP